MRQFFLIHRELSEKMLLQLISAGAAVGGRDRAASDTAAAGRLPPHRAASLSSTAGRLSQTSKISLEVPIRYAVFIKETALSSAVSLISHCTTTSKYHVLNQWARCLINVGQSNPAFEVVQPDCCGQLADALVSKR